MLAAYNNLAGRQRWHEAWYPAVNLGATGVALAAAAASGLTAADLGLRPDRLAAGLRSRPGRRPRPWPRAGSALAAVPATRPVLGDQRVTGLTWPQVAYQAAVRIPVGTVLWEETAFRGVLQAALHRVLPGPAAMALTSARVRRLAHPAHRRCAPDQPGRDRPPGQGWGRSPRRWPGRPPPGCCCPRCASGPGSLAAPVLLHLTANCGATLAARSAAGWNIRRAHVVARSIR